MGAWHAGLQSSEAESEQPRPPRPTDRCLAPGLSDATSPTNTLSPCARHPGNGEHQANGMQSSNTPYPFNITIAALCPGAPITPPPGCAPLPHKYNPATGVL